MELALAFNGNSEWRYDGSAAPVHHPNARCERLCAVGGMRRGKTEMKDLELLYIPKMVEEQDPGDLFGGTMPVNDTDRMLADLLADDILKKRLSSAGHPAWGPWNKLAVHVRTGLPVDLFSATGENWFNRLVVTTGPAIVNILIASRAKNLGWEWEVNQAGFVPRGTTWESAPRDRRTMRSEREVFEFVGFPLLKPFERNKLENWRETKAA